MNDQTIQPTGEVLNVARSSRWAAFSVRRWIWRGVLALVLAGLVPVVLTILYAPSFVHPVSTLMLRDGVTLQGYDRRWVPIDAVAPVLKYSVIMSEDGQFCRHPGIDLGELRLVVDDALHGAATRGASTITMQTVKNLYLWQGRSFVRKALEVPYAVYFDFVLSKRRIMEIYLNVAEWAPGVYGIEAGSQHYFGIPASKLSAKQAALMAVTLPNPARRDPAKPSAGLRRLAATIQKRVVQFGERAHCVD